MQLNIRIDEETHAAIKAAAAKEKIPVSTWVRGVIKFALDPAEANHVLMEIHALLEEEDRYTARVFGPPPVL